MTPEAQRQAVATFWFDCEIANLGLTLVQNPPGTEGYMGMDLSGYWIYRQRDGKSYGMNWESSHACRTGNIKQIAARYAFTSDLNAIAQAEAKLPDNTNYYTVLHGVVCCADAKTNVLSEKRFISATAAQRCEALVRTIGRWQEGEAV